MQVGVETEAKASDTKGPEAKKRKVENVTPSGKRKVRVASLLLKYVGAAGPRGLSKAQSSEVGEADSLARRKAGDRTQAAAERLLMQTLEELRPGDKAPSKAKPSKIKAK